MIAIAGIGALGIQSAGAQEAKPLVDYSAGKTPAQLFTTDCSSCHKSPQGLARGKDQSALASFLRAHYTTKTATAGALAGYLSSLGAGNARGPATTERRPAEPAAQRQRQAVPAGEAKPEDEAAKPRPARASTDAKPARPPKPLPAASEKDGSDDAAPAAASGADTGEEPRRRATVPGRTRQSAAPPRPSATVPGGEPTAVNAPATPRAARPPRTVRPTPAEAEDAKLKAYTTPSEAAKPAEAETREVDHSLTSYARTGADAQTTARTMDADGKPGETPARRKRDPKAVQAPADGPHAPPAEITQSAPAEPTGTLPAPPRATDPVPAPSAPVPADAPPSAVSPSSIDR